MPVKQVVQMLPPDLSAFLKKLRKQKRKGIRPKPSIRLIDESSILDEKFRKKLLNKVAELVDERLFGRNEMCKQFAVLMERSLNELGYNANAVIGTASYDNGYEWEHSWVLVEGEIIDGNADSMQENPMVPKNMKPHSYWGPKERLPSDRSFKVTTEQNEPDPDIEEYWWPELKAWLSENKPK